LIAGGTHLLHSFCHAIQYAIRATFSQALFAVQKLITLLETRLNFTMEENFARTSAIHRITCYRYFVGCIFVQVYPDHPQYSKVWRWLS